WREHKYGRDNADEHLYDMQQQYFVEAYGKQVKLIREDYFHPDEMFDAHSYQKGALILHMLRKYLGDQAFFDGLSLYLKKFQYGTAEIHNLRQCFEESSGEDLTWFFDQWFFKAGHPNLEVIHNYDEEVNFYSIQVSQTQDLQELGAYRLPVKVEFHFGDSVYSELLDIRNSEESFSWEMAVKPDWVSFDAANQLLAKVHEVKSQEAWLAQLKYSKLFNDRQNALLYLNEEADNMELLYEACAISLSDPYYRIRIKGMDLMKRLEPDRIASFSMLIIDQAENHPKSATRAAAFSLLAYNPVNDLDKTIQKGLNDSSFQVNGAALNLLEKTDPELALKQAEKWAESPEDALKYTALGVLAKSENDYSATFVKAWKEEEGNKFYLVALISQYLKKSTNSATTVTLLDLINGFEPDGDEDFFVVLFIAQCNQQMEVKWEEIKAASPDDLKRQTEANRVLESIIHIY
ncbi:MAG: M1 family metallopeptidase, partial [Bacteroidia bacterium]